MTEVFVASKFYAPAAEADVLGVFSTLEAATERIMKDANKSAVVIKTGNGGAYVSQSGDVQLHVERFELDK